MTAKTSQSQSRCITWEVCPVKRPLLSVARITKQGSEVYLGEEEAYIKNKATGQKTMLRREKNVWMLDVWDEPPATGFGRPAKR